MAVKTIGPEQHVTHILYNCRPLCMAPGPLCVASGPLGMATGPLCMAVGPLCMAPGFLHVSVVPLVGG